MLDQTSFNHLFVFLNHSAVDIIQKYASSPTSCPSSLPPLPLASVEKSSDSYTCEPREGILRRLLEFQRDSDKEQICYICVTLET